MMVKLGIVLYGLLVGYPPIWDHDIEELIDDITNGSISVGLAKASIILRDL